MRPTFLLALTVLCTAALPLRAVPDADAPNGAALAKQIDAVELPAFNPTQRGDAAYMKDFMAKLDKATEARAQLALKLYDQSPDHPKAFPTLVERWQVLGQIDAARAVRETEQFLKDHPKSTHRADALFWRALASSRAADKDPKQALPAIEEFIAAKPDDEERGAFLLMNLARAVKEPEEQVKLYERIGKAWPNGDMAKSAQGHLRQAKGVGQPFELSFEDAISGRKISVASLKGKVLVVDFWATWCGPCVAAMPHMKEVYAKYKDKGVEFLGVSLDAPESKDGLKKLKAFVEKESIAWPQYYQGNAWESDFSRSWGIDSIPAMFIVDADGKLYSTNIEDKLEEVLDKLIAKRDGKAEVKAAPKAAANK